TTDNGEAYAGLYTADATFGQSTGYAQLAALGREQPQGPQYVRHYLTNHVIEPFAGQAIGKQYLVGVDMAGRPCALICPITSSSRLPAKPSASSIWWSSTCPNPRREPKAYRGRYSS